MQIINTTWPQFDKTTQLQCLWLSTSTCAQPFCDVQEEEESESESRRKKSSKKVPFSFFGRLSSQLHFSDHHMLQGQNKSEKNKEEEAQLGNIGDMVLSMSETTKKSLPIPAAFLFVAQVTINPLKQHLAACRKPPIGGLGC